MSNRRLFLKSIPIMAAAGAVGMAGLARAANPMVAETDPQAAALGYKADTTKVDQAKYPKHAPDQHCGNCALYQGGTAAQGGCPLFAGKDVANKGWCGAWAKKA
ncbi:high-potential iron-sulfur protein [Ralstonia pseudosolanacearum]|uniref:high-potential iron-sulfur protein n=1 Tax=Ralstonia pseudosolanacearum TaxID=1310165 RepID=UPI001C77A6AD|nr:high-potential iron-sulfur protein [Ralstonia sp. RS642]QWQ12314.1 high-potential iron-sulfur protein [Ralstonia solanacearum]UZF25393.1 high-potential iron-sulfur protein [Ralstonia sp. RS642]